MEEKINPWKANLQNGLILGLAYVVFSLLMYFMNMTFNKSVGYLFILLEIVMVYFFIKSYRDNYLHGNITYGQSVGAGVIIFLYSAVIGAIFTYLLYTVIDKGLTAKLLANVEETIRKAGKVPEGSIDTVMAFQRKILKPEIMAISGLIGGVFFGTIISLVVGIFTKKEGNPLLDASVTTPE